MNKFRFVERKIVEKEINIKAKDELEAIDLFLKIKNQTEKQFSNIWVKNKSCYNYISPAMPDGTGS